MEEGLTRMRDRDYIKVSQLDSCGLECCQTTNYYQKLEQDCRHAVRQIVNYACKDRVSRGGPCKNSFLLLETAFKLTLQGKPVLQRIKSAAKLPTDSAFTLDFYSKLVDDMYDLTVDRLFVDVE